MVKLLLLFVVVFVGVMVVDQPVASNPQRRVVIVKQCPSPQTVLPGFTLTPKAHKHD